jgi:large subunit ribosomal protein L18
MKRIEQKNAGRARRKIHIRQKLSGTMERPRMTVFRSNKHIYVQVVDDTTGKTLASASTLSPEVRDAAGKLNKRDAAKKVGELAGRRCVEAKITKVAFDRNGYQYAGRIAAVADAAREAGLKF